MKSANKHWNALPKPVVLAVLGGTEGKRHIAATLVEAGGQKIRLQLESALPRDTAIKIEVDGGLVLGAVSWCEPAGSSFLATVEVDQVIPDAAGLARLVSAVLGQRPPASNPYSPQDQPGTEQTTPQTVLRPSPR
ncbi:MAG: hypothetical protein SGI92_00875 [Bryobacteraceae bacterium]|nr:hypothetical protein [Bryobacteraceae bacterium]